MEATSINFASLQIRIIQMVRFGRHTGQTGYGKRELRFLNSLLEFLECLLIPIPLGPQVI